MPGAKKGLEPVQKRIAAEWRHKRVIDKWLDGECKTPGEAWNAVYPHCTYESSRARASELFNSAWGKDYLKQQQTSLATMAMINRAMLAKEYMDLAQHAIALEQTATAKGCLDSLARMCGLNEPEKLIVAKEEISDGELHAKLARLITAAKT